MAREEHNREDLLREATALVRRAELSLDEYDENVVIGFRRDGSASIYIGAEPVYQFNSNNELRRAHLDGKLVKAECGELISLTRQRQAGEVQLQRHVLTEQESCDMMATLRGHLDVLRGALDQQRFQLIGRVPPDIDVVSQISGWLRNIGNSVLIANAPNAR